MKKTRKFLSLVMAVLMLCSCFVVANVQAATFNDINQSGVFVKQQTNYTCTLAAAVMLVRRTAMAAGNNNWSSITESSMRGTAWLEGQGLYYNFTYAGVSVGHSTISSNRKNTYINLLKTYPQGVVAWNSSQPHAVLLTDYDANTDTFYCADPANGTASGRIPLSSSSINGSGQDGKINNLDHYWYVKSPSITLTSNEPTSIIYPTSGATYKIAAGVGNNQYLDFSLSTNNVQTYEDCDASTDPSWVKSQYFTLKHCGDGWYQMINYGNNMAVDVAGASPISGTNIWQWEPIVYDAQLFRFYDAGDGYCYIKSKLGTYVDVQNGDNLNNTNVWAHSFNGTNAQKWKLIQKDVPKYEFDVNIEINGNAHMGGFSGFTYDVYFNDVLSRNDVKDCCEMVELGTKWEIRDIKCPDGYKYKGGSTIGSISGYTDTRLKFEGAPTLNVDFVHFSATNCSDKKVVSGNTYGTLPTPQRPGFVFDGWYTALNGGTKVTSSTKVTATTNHTLYAHWKTQTVYFDVNHSGIYVNLFRAVNGEIVDGVSFDSNTQILSLNGDFSSFAPILDFPFKTAANDVYRVRVDKIDGTISDSSCIVIDALDDNMKNLSNYDGRVYMDCCHGDVKVRDKTWNISTIAESAIKSIRLSAWRQGTEKCECKNIKIKIKIEKIKSSDVYSTEYSPAAQVINKESSYGTLPTPTRAGYTFDGWYTSATGGTKVTSSSVVNVSGDQTLYAHWTCNHNTTEVRNEATPTCIETGYTGDTYCLTCGNKIKPGTVIDKVECVNNDGDDMCDFCERDMSEPDEPENKPCSCNCHKGGIVGFFFKLINFFEKIFGINKVCACGVKH